MLDAVKYDAAEGAAVGGPLLGGQVGQLMLLQLTLKPPQIGSLINNYTLDEI